MGPDGGANRSTEPSEKAKAAHREASAEIAERNRKTQKEGKARRQEAERRRAEWRAQNDD